MLAGAEQQPPIVGGAQALGGAGAMGMAGVEPPMSAGNTSSRMDNGFAQEALAM